ncbi:MAG TPA: response regulator [Anaerohalosphaeraceae bacterium]|jgi:CheY-like chemotaxis protein|nr:response regulator [Anaerohalosphaeraceae bacterium]HRT51583.1 response regulator [Anaerohalosphaeraceae bacterium]HRT87582.1 response regulator [Anaerohalosphaeraceae bacterium]
MSTKKILIVDDDPDITEAMTVVLESKGYEVASAANSTAAMKQVEASRPDLIILDVMMDTQSEGFVFSRQIKNDNKTKDIPILMITGVKDKVGIDFKDAAGDESWLPVEEYLDKPVKPDVLLAKVASLLGSPDGK